MACAIQSYGSKKLMKTRVQNGLAAAFVFAVSNLYFDEYSFSVQYSCDCPAESKKQEGI
jgi:hypothetical protein